MITRHILQPLNANFIYKALIAFISNMPTCNGHGYCLSKDYGVYDYEQEKCPHKCSLLKCPNFLICQSMCPQVILSFYGDVCPKCKDFGKLVFEESVQCSLCLKMAPCVRQTDSSVAVCFDCFSSA